MFSGVALVFCVVYALSLLLRVVLRHRDSRELQFELLLGISAADF